ncbi:2-hydroxyacyl-CoA lyase [Iris pallida]|uniref:2-hydroxyacyl-CoA lyase n=1 Tax=Iris pallida TaxID=29817 RepID=A0AAX6EBH2_IRIPA|nr:2-hydroxyacyl-CoA lyase [Iris pallida]
MATSAETLTQIDGNALVARALSLAGVSHMFGVVGIPVTALATRAVSAGIRFLAFHNEQSAGYAASAYGYLSGSAGVFLTVSGPGCVHGLAGLANAQANAWPAVMISGSCDQKDVGRGDFQELDQIAAVKPFVKLSAKATDISQIPHLVFEVIRTAVSGRPGGCYLDLPSDVLHQKISESDAARILAEAETPRVQELSISETLDIQSAVSLLRNAERPLIVFGKGAAFSRAEDSLKKLIQTTGIPFLPTPMGKGLVPDTHELAATAARSLVIGQCDVAVVVGARLNWLLHFGEPPRWSKDVKFILIDISKEEIELRKPYLGLVGDAKRVVDMINHEIKDNPFCFGKSHPWVEAISKKVKENVAKMEAQLAKEVVPFNFLTPMKIIRDAILAEESPAPVLVSEGANTMDVGRAVLVQNEPRTRLDAGTWGTMGVGLGYCIAAAVASPGRLVVAVEGDSGFGFSAMEVETLVRYQLPVVVIVFNNGGVYGGDRRNPDEVTGPYKDDPAPTSFVPEAAYHRLMEAFGGKGYVASTPQELKSALAASFSAREPAVINVIIDPYAGAESGRMQHKN